jgi:anaerobic magnesium-protoporphyrin IX monomethyl ester cyclase
MAGVDVLVVTPFRRPTFRGAISSWYPGEEPWDSPPFCIAGALQLAGLEVAVLALQNIFPAFNEDADWRDLRSMLAAHDARVVLFVSDPLVASRSTATTFGIRMVVEALKDLTHDPLVGVCGRLATTAWEHLLQALPVDFVVLGEPDEIIGDVVLQLLAKDAAVASTHPSVVNRAHLEGGASGIAYARIDEPDSCALPAFHLARESLEYFASRRPSSATVPFSLRTSYGCRFKCRFCAGVPYWREYRRKSSERVESELRLMEADTDGRARLAFLEDEIFTLDPDHVRGIVRVLADRGIVLDGLYTHASLLTPAIAQELQPVTRKVFLGLDSAEDRVLRHMHKGQVLDTVLEAAGVAAEVGLAVHLEWIIGSPAETVDSLATSLIAIFNLLQTGLVESINTYVYCPHPGTEYAEHADIYGMEVVADLEMIQESGGYPTAEIPELTRNQVFSAYLLSQLITQETLAARAAGGPTTHVAPSNRKELLRILNQVGSADAKSLAP